MKAKIVCLLNAPAAVAAILILATLTGCVSSGSRGLFDWWQKPLPATAATASNRGPATAVAEAPIARQEPVAASDSSWQVPAAMAVENPPDDAIVLSDARIEPLPQVTPPAPSTEAVAATTVHEPSPSEAAELPIQLVSDRSSSSSRPRVQGAVASTVKRVDTPRPRPRVLHVTALTFDDQVLRSEAPVLVDFYATWCGPCKALSPTLDQLAAENPRAKVVKVNIDANPELASRYGVRSIPHLFVFKDGQVVSQEKGVVSKSRLKAMLAL